MRNAATAGPPWAAAAILGCALCALSGCNTQESGAVAPPSTRQSNGSATPSARSTPDGNHPAGNQSPASTKPKRPTNHLAGQSSPYLLLHAHNPVDWYPWGPEAFEKARRENKPIFLSVGYSSCYWCHVMERLVFENEEIAAYMNEHFVSIKVDREERPDVDDIYMTSLYVYLQAIGAPPGGGWPLSMFLTTEGKPFAGGTYFPPDDEGDRLGFRSVLRRIAELWKDRHQEVADNAEYITTEVRRAMKPRLVLTPVEISRSLVGEAVQAVAGTFDEKYAGVGFNPANPNGPKFPVPTKLALLQYASRHDADEHAATIVTDTLDRLAAGGIHDHLGGGFHRYSTDRYWHVPHFEKMLYDQAQLADVYVEAFRQTGEAKYRLAAEDIFRFVAREMTDPEGGFYSALDAETDGVEGRFYVWSREEVRELLGEEEAGLFRLVYGMDEASPFEHGYVLRLVEPIAEVARKQNIPPEVLAGRLADMRQTLLAAREKRKPLLKDDKILAAWNGLMIRAYAHAGNAFNDKSHLESAERAALFVLGRMRDDRKRLLRSYRNGQAKLNAYLDDYAFLVDGLLALHEATGNEQWLNAARRLTDQQIELFWDETGKGFFFTSGDHEELIARTKNANDSAVPSGSGVSVRNLLRLASLTGEPKYRRYARETLEVFAPGIDRSPAGMVTLAVAMGEYLDDPDFNALRGNPPRSEQPAGANQGQQPQPGPTGSTQTAALPFPAAHSTGGTSPDGAPGETDLPQGTSPVGTSPGDAPNGDKPPGTKPKDKYAGLVTARAFLALDKLPAGGVCRVAVFVDVKQGWHINANPPDPDFLIPTRLQIKSKLGAKLDMVAYPAGRQVKNPGTPPLHVYEGRAVIHGVLAVPASAAGKTDELQIVVLYQACNEQQCLPIKTVKLTGKVPVAAAGESPKPINQNLFAKPRPKK